jgi:heat shock protein 1/8
VFLPIAKGEVAVAYAQARNAFETYVYNIRKSFNKEKLASKFDPVNQSKLKSAISETISWLDASQAASKDEYESRQRSWCKSI